MCFVKMLKKTLFLFFVIILIEDSQTQIKTARHYFAPKGTPLDPATGLPYVMQGSPYPGIMESPCQPEHPGSTSMYCGSQPKVEWLRINPRNARMYSGKAVVASSDGTPLMIIRAHYGGDLIPGKLDVEHNSAFVPYDGYELRVDDIEVCCIPAESYRWLPSREGGVLPNAVVGGKASDGEPLYIGRGLHEGSLIPGKIHPTKGALYITFEGKEIALRDYEVLTTIPTFK